MQTLVAERSACLSSRPSFSPISSQTICAVTLPICTIPWLTSVDSHPARYALTRLSDNLQHTPLVQALISLLASTMERKHATVYAQAENLFNVVRDPAFFDAKLASVIGNLIITFVGKTSWIASTGICSQT